MRPAMLFANIISSAGHPPLPLGRVTSTARKGSKWADKPDARPGDIIDLQFTDGPVFGQAVVTKREVVALYEVIERAEENHANHGLLESGGADVGGLEARYNLVRALQAVYGWEPSDAPYTIVHFIVLNPES